MPTIREFSSSLGAEAIHVTSEAFQVSLINADDKKYLVKDMGHFFSSVYGENICFDLPSLSHEGCGVFPTVYSETSGFWFAQDRAVVKARILELLSEKEFSFCQDDSIFSIQSDSAHGYRPEVRLESRCDGRFFCGDLGYLSESSSGNSDHIWAPAGFYTLDPLEDTSPFTAVGDPYGLLIQDGNILNPALLHRACLLATPEGPIIDILSIEDMRVELETQYGSEDISLYVLDPCNPVATTNDENAVDFIVSGRIVSGWKFGGGVSIPGAAVVLRVHDRTQPQGKQLVEELMQNRQVRWVLLRHVNATVGFQAGPQFMCNGEYFLNEKEANTFKMSAEKQVTVPFSFWRYLHQKGKPKSFVGKDAYGRLHLFAVDNADLTDLVAVAREHELVDALLIDSGGSSMVYQSGNALFHSRDTRGTDHQRWERPTSVAIVLA